MKIFFKIFILTFLTFLIQGGLGWFVTIHTNSVIMYYLFVFYFLILRRCFKIGLGRLLGLVLISIFITYIIGDIINALANGSFDLNDLIEKQFQPYAVFLVLSSYFGAITGYIIAKMFHTKYQYASLIVPLVMMPLLH